MRFIILLCCTASEAPPPVFFLPFHEGLHTCCEDQSELPFGLLITINDLKGRSFQDKTSG